MGATALALFAVACSQNKEHRQLTPAEKAAPIVAAVTLQPSHELDQIVDGDSPAAVRDQASLKRANERSEAQGVASATTAVHAQVRLKKAHLYDRTFLYGFDLQYSSGADAEYELIPQSQALGHIPATFRRLGDVLQLVGDQSRLFESDINHPEILISEYKIVSEDADSLSVTFERGGLVVNEGLNGKGAKPPKQTWVRSFEFVEQGNYLLQETGLLLDDGSVMTVLESTFPRDSLVPAQYEPLLADPAREPLAERYRFLANEKVFLDFKDGNRNVRSQTQVANRYHLGSDGTIDWYVTANAPDEFLPALKSGVEGWNRYFEAQLGRKVMRFLGRLPAGIKIGDPRFNVINWDTVQDAGAAYESQASDPTTGIQSHSLIYMPYAWYNIGAELWHRRVDAGSVDVKALTRALMPKGDKEVFGNGHLSVRCVRAVDDIAANAMQLIAELNKTGTSPSPTADEFGRRILITTLFHEVGHALGLAHNFKGSLSFDGEQAVSSANPTTDSIMDYNYYMHELALFGDIGTSDGHALEYDRQIISQLYNKGVDVKDTDKVLPACNDDDADNTTGGVDPLCQRYDSEVNPARGLLHAYNNITHASGAAGYERQTLSEALSSVKAPLVQKLIDPATGADAAALIAAAGDIGDKAGELVRFYVAAGAQSLRGNLRTNDKALRLWMPDSLKGTAIDEIGARSLYFDTYQTVAAWHDLPAVPKAAAASLADAARDAIKQNPHAGGDATTREETAAKAYEAFKKAFDAKVSLSLGLVRQAVIGLISYNETNPFAARVGSGTDSHASGFEQWSVNLLSAAVVQGLGNSGTPADATERELAAKGLATYKTIDQAFADTIAKLTALVAAGRTDGNQTMIDEGRRLLKVLNDNK